MAQHSSAPGQSGPNPIFVALDTSDLGQALDWARALKGAVGGLKIGLEFITALGPKGVAAIVDEGLPVFADVKFHDIPNTVAGAVRALSQLGIGIFNVHASGGRAMMEAARDAARRIQGADPAVIAVTVLTSLDDSDLEATGVAGLAPAHALRLATLAQISGLDGVVCSAHDIAAIRAACGAAFRLVVPGVRPEGSDRGDQKRVMTPVEAHRLGADILVIGRPITGAADPAQAARAIGATLGQKSSALGRP